MTTTVLVVCTANAGRSPLAEALLRRHLGAHGRDGEVEVRSAGVDAAGGHLSEAVVSVAAEHGVDVTPHRCTQLTPEQVAEADLVLCMTDRHVRHVERSRPPAAARTFLLGRLGRLLAGAGPRRPDEGLAAYLERVRRGVDRLEENPAADQIPDPYGGPPGALAATAERLEALAEAVVEHLWPAPRGPADQCGVP